MTDIKQDIYETNQSSKNSVSNIGQQIKVDLKLKPNINDLNGGVIRGTVKNLNGNPINDAYIKLLSSDSEPLRHTISNEDGNYILSGIKEGNYSIMAIGRGYKLKEEKNISIKNKEEIIIDFNLEGDQSQNNSIIVGKLMDFSDGQGVEGAVISLYKLDVNNEKSLQGLSYSNEYGEFSFRDIPNGKYNILTNILGYKSTNIDVLITLPGQISPIDIYVSKDPFTSRGTVSGVILDNVTNKPVDRGEVILYKVKEDNSLIPMACTKTNKNGVYLFINVPGGTYKIKSNAVEIIDINIEDTLYRAPDFKSFIIEPIGVYTPLIYYAKDGFLENGARVDPVTGYVTGLGGSDNGEVIVSLPALEGNYELGFEYLATSNQQYLILSINGEIKNLTLPVTDSMEPSSAKYYSLTTQLHPGMNSVKFFNENGRLAPDINKVTLKMFPYTKDYLAKDGRLYLGATVSPKTGFVTNIGPNDGYLAMDILVQIGGEYEFQIQYLSGDKDRILSVSVTNIYDNDAQLGNFTLPKTDSYNVEDAKFYTMKFNLVGGNNIVYFYNSQDQLAPDINIIRIKQIISKENFNVTDVQLFNGAEIQNGLITNIVSGLGYITFTANILGTYSYNLILEYKSKSSTNICYIDINGISTGDKYSFEPTGDTLKKKIIPLNLGFGQNKIKIYNPAK